MTMKGKNTLEMNQATMQIAMQSYFNKIFTTPPRVVKVSPATNVTPQEGQCFTIDMEEPEKLEDEEE
jgi:hypothetical protein